MSLKTVRQNAERQLITWLQAHVDTKDWGAFHFRCSRLHVRPDEEDVFLTIKTLFENKPALMYLFHDGDVVVVWQHHVDETYPLLEKRFYERYAPAKNEKLERFYHLSTDRDDLRALCEYKESTNDTIIVPSNPAGRTQPETVEKPDTTIYYDFSSDSPEQIRLLAQKYAYKLSNFPPVQEVHKRAFRSSNEARISRKGISILIVEDQPFSRQLLLNVLERLCRVRAASDAEHAVELYAAEAPNIVFVDIDLPGTNGHQLVSMLRSMDEEVYAVMVTANNYVEDVDCARANGVKGFVVKPYSKTKILQAIERYIEHYKSKPTSKLA